MQALHIPWNLTYFKIMRIFYLQRCIFSLWSLWKTVKITLGPQHYLILSLLKDLCIWPIFKKFSKKIHPIERFNFHKGVQPMDSDITFSLWVEFQWKSVKKRQCKFKLPHELREESRESKFITRVTLKSRFLFPLKVSEVNPTNVCAKYQDRKVCCCLHGKEAYNNS